jgi:hypothetical protein
MGAAAGESRAWMRGIPVRCLGTCTRIADVSLRRERGRAEEKGGPVSAGGEGDGGAGRVCECLLVEDCSGRATEHVGCEGEWDRREQMHAELFSSGADLAHTPAARARPARPARASNERAGPTRTRGQAPLSLTSRLTPLSSRESYML